MKSVALRVLACVMGCLPAAAIGAESSSRPALVLAPAQPLMAASLTATGRVKALVCARISSRVTGHIVEFGKDAAGGMLDAGMTVQAGQVLLRINDTTFTNAVSVSEASLKLANAELANLTAPTRDERLEQLRQALAELDAKVADREREEKRFRRLVEVEKTLPATRLEEVQTELAMARAGQRAARAKLQEAQNGPTRTEIAVAEAHVQQAQAALQIARDDLRDSTVRAPFDGMIAQRFKSPGDYLTSTPPTEVLELVAVDRLEAELCLPESYLNSIQAQKTQVTLHSPLLRNGLTLPVARVVADVDPSTGTFAIRVRIPPERRENLVPGAFVTGELGLDGQGQGVIVPLRALVSAEGKSWVFVAANGKMIRREVEVGDRLTEGVVIKSGLAGGQKVIVGPADELRDGSPLPDYLQPPK